MNHLIEIDELRALGRPIGKHVSEEKLLAYITEVEQMNIKPSLGEALFNLCSPRVIAEMNTSYCSTVAHTRTNAETSPRSWD